MVGFKGCGHQLRVGGQEYAQGVSVLEDLWLGQR